MRALAALALLAGALAPAVAHAGSLELVGHSPLSFRGMNSALAVHGDFAYVGSRSDGPPPKGGIAVVDISRPSAPRHAGDIGLPDEGAPGLSSRELRVLPGAGLLVVLRFACEAPQTCLDYGAPASYAFYDIAGANAGAPKPIATYEPSRVPHEFFLWEDPQRPGRTLLYMSTLTEAGGDDLLVADVSRVRDGVVQEVATWAANIPNGSGGQVDLHSLSVAPDGRRAYLAHLAAGFLVVDTSDLADARPQPKIREVTPIDRRASWGAPGAHSALPLPGRDWALVTDEVYGGTFGIAGALGVDVAIGCPWGWSRLVDVSDPARPAVRGEYRVSPYNDRASCTEDRALESEQTTYSSHNPTVTRDLAFVTWHSAGLQAVDLSDPAAPVRTAEFRPDPLPFVLTEDPTFSTGANKAVFWSYPVVKDGLVYVADIRNGLYVLRYRGAHEAQVDCASFLEGNSNVANGASPCPLALGGEPALVRHGTVRVPAACATRLDAGCRGTLRLRAGKRVAGRARYALRPGQRSVIPVRAKVGKRRRVLAVARTAVPGAPDEIAEARLTLRRGRARGVRPAARPRTFRFRQQRPPSARDLAAAGLVCLL